MLNPNEHELIEFVQAHAETLPVAKRIKVYRGLADCIPSPNHRIVFTRMAEILEQAEARCREFRFNFTAGGKS